MTTYIERFVREYARSLCDRIRVDQTRADGSVRLGFGDRSASVSMDQLILREEAFTALGHAVHDLLGLPRDKPPKPEPPTVARESVIIQLEGGQRARLVPPDGPDAAGWDPDSWKGQYRIQIDPGGARRLYEFVELPPDADGTHVFGWKQIDALPEGQ